MITLIIPYFVLSEYRKAIHDFTKAIKYDSQNCRAYSNRGLCYRIVQNYKRALEDFNRSIEIDEYQKNRQAIDAEDGVAVVGVEPGSSAAEAGIRQGDVIIEVNKQPISSIDDVKEQLSQSKNKDRLLLLVQRQDGTLYIPLEQQG